MFTYDPNYCCCLIKHEHCATTSLNSFSEDKYHSGISNGISKYIKGSFDTHLHSLLYLLKQSRHMATICFSSLKPEGISDSTP